MTKTNRAKKFFKKYWMEILFITPLILFVFSFTIVPIMQTIGMGFKDQYTEEISLSSYRYMAQRPQFFAAIKNTLVFTGNCIVCPDFSRFLDCHVAETDIYRKRTCQSIYLIAIGSSYPGFRCRDDLHLPYFRLSERIGISPGNLQNPYKLDGQLLVRYDSDCVCR